VRIDARLMKVNWLRHATLLTCELYKHCSGA